MYCCLVTNGSIFPFSLRCQCPYGQKLSYWFFFLCFVSLWVISKAHVESGLYTSESERGL